jgi:hypothetical protein
MKALLINALALGLLALLFAAGLKLPLWQGRWRIAMRALGVLGALAAAGLVNLVVYRNDQHFDLTHEQAFTPAPETQAVLRGLQQDVELVYFYQSQNPAGRAAKDMVEIMGRSTPHLKVRTVDPDQQPALANQMGVRMYNAALLVAGERRIEVISTEDREIALGILRLLRADERPVCFLTGHGEYDIDNYEFHTHFEGAAGHNHDAVGMSVVKMEQHGLGRLRRALDKLGYKVRKLNLATGQGAGVPSDCAAVLGANPRNTFAPPELKLLAQYLEQGGNLALFLEPDYVVDEGLAALLARGGVRVDTGIVVDPVSHYFTDDQMVAVERYATHPSTVGLALSFFPGARPLQAQAAPGVKAQALFASSDKSTVTHRPGTQEPTTAGDTQEARRALAVASEGTLAPGAKPFKLVVVGDADFASNSFYPYLANADLVLGITAWLRGEQRGPAMKPPVEVLPTVVMTNGQMQTIFLLCVVLVPGLCASIGVAVWWRRRS